MGWGDEIMITGEARRLNELTGRRVKVRGQLGNARMHTIFDGNPRIASPHDHGDAEEFEWIEWKSGNRPYIDYEKSTKERWAYTDWKCLPGELYIKREPPGDYVIIEPHIKANASPNKAWLFDRARALVQAVPEKWLQMGNKHTRRATDTPVRNTPHFLDACRVLSGAKLYIGPEGGLHHAAAALGIPAIVIFGGMTSPANTGYDNHVNLFSPDGSPCGWRIPCDHCKSAMDAITVEMVADMIPIALSKGKN